MTAHVLDMSLADGISGVILSQDIMEGNECQSKKDYKELGAGPAVTLRRRQNYFGLSMETVHLLQ